MIVGERSQKNLLTIWCCLHTCAFCSKTPEQQQEILPTFEFQKWLQKREKIHLQSRCPVCVCVKSDDDDVDRYLCKVKEAEK